MTAGQDDQEHTSAHLSSQDTFTTATASSSQQGVHCVDHVHRSIDRAKDAIFPPDSVPSPFRKRTRSIFQTDTARKRMNPLPLDESSSEHETTYHDAEASTQEMDHEEEDESASEQEMDVDETTEPPHEEETTHEMLPSDLFRAVLGQAMRPSGGSRRLQAHVEKLKGNDVSEQLIALEDLNSEICIGDEETLAGLFRVDDLVQQLLRLIHDQGAFDEITMDIALLACRCLYNTMVSLPSSIRQVVNHGGVSKLCQKIVEMQFIDIAEQAIGCLVLLSQDFPAAVVKEGGIGACLMYLDFFATSTQRNAVKVVANCCQKVSNDAFESVLDSLPTVERLLSNSDTKIVESVCTAYIRLVDQFRTDRTKLERMVAPSLQQAVLQLISPTSPSAISSPIHESLLRMLRLTVSASPLLADQLHELQVAELLYHVLTGHSAPTQEVQVPPGSVASTIAKLGDKLPKLLDLVNKLLPSIPTKTEEPKEDETKEETKELKWLDRFVLLLLPVLVDAYSATVRLEYRQSISSSLLKMVHLAGSELLLAALKDIKFSSFIAVMISSRNHHSVIVNGLSLIELLLEKIPACLLPCVAFELGLLAETEHQPVVEQETPAAPPESDTDLGFASFISNLAQHTSAAEPSQETDETEQHLRNMVRQFLHDRHEVGRKTQQDDGKKSWVWIQQHAARIISTYFSTKTEGEQDTPTSKVVDALRELAKSLFLGEHVVVLNTLTAIAAYFKGTTDGISSYELMRSGLLDALLSFLQDDQHLDALTLHQRHVAFQSVFFKAEDHVTKAAIIVKLLQESLARMESFELVSSSCVGVHDGTVDCVDDDTCVDAKNALAAFTRPFNLRLELDEASFGKAGKLAELRNIPAAFPMAALDSIVRRILAEAKEEVGEVEEEKLATSSKFETLAVDKQDVSMPDAREDASDKDEPMEHDEEEHESDYDDMDDDEEEERHQSEAVDGFDFLGHDNTHDDVVLDVVVGVDGQVTPSRAMETKARDDMHLAYYMDNVQVPLDETVYSFIYRSNAHITSNWSTMHTLVIKQLSTVEETPQPSNTIADDPVHRMLLLMRQLFHLNLQVAQDSSNVSLVPVHPKEFINHKLAAKLRRQLDVPLLVVSHVLPSWCTYCATHFPFLFPMDIRRSLLHLTSFGHSRVMTKWPLTQRQRNYLSDLNRHIFYAPPKFKARVARNHLLQAATYILQASSQTAPGYNPLDLPMVEIEYVDEVGTGLGPTLEFYSLVSREFTRKEHGVWRDEAGEGDHVHAPNGLFPSPLPLTTSDQDTQELFYTLGQFVARSVLDDRRIDVPFHPVFLQLVMDPHYVVDTADIKSIDETLGRSMEFLSNYAHRFAELMQLNDTKDIQQEELEAQLQQLEKHVEALALDFSLPGVPGYQLMEHETLVTIFNLQHYLDLLRDALVGKGIETQVTSFRRGFNTIFPVERMRLFTPLELAQMLGDQHDDSEHWTLSALYDTIHADHGYTLDSPSIHHLLGILTAFASEERRMFLLFITGSPRLPHGGFKKLVPKLTIVRKLPDYPLTADAYLPSVMTCANYLKLPDYSSQHVMRLKLVQAMHDGQSSFHLS